MSKLDAAHQFLERGAQAIRPVVHESARIVADSTGMQAWQVEVLLPGVAGSRNLARMYGNVSAAVRA